MAGQLTKILMFLGLILLTACSLPRGAAFENEIAGNKEPDELGYGIEYVTRENLGTLNNWPATGWNNSYHWLAAQRGPAYPRIASGDKIDLTIWDNETNSLLASQGQKQAQVNTMEVSPAGEVFVPYIGGVLVSGMTPNEARDDIQERLEDFAPAAQLQLRHTPGRNRTVDLVSGVRSPGNYPLADQNVSVLSAIAQGGGVAPTLRYPIVQLMRDGKTYRIPAKTLFADASKNVTLRGKDKVIVVEDDRYFISLGATGREQQVFFQQEDLTALEALSVIGGLDDSRANLKGILILREYRKGQLGADASTPDFAQTVFVLDLTNGDGLFAARNFQIYPGDTVLATESAVNSVRTVFGLIGSALGIASRLN